MFFYHYLYRFHALTTFTSLLLFIVSIFSMPFLGSAPPDPFYVLKVMPWEYWVGFTLAITALLMGIILHEGGCRTFLTVLSLFLLTGYVHVLPKLLFSNPIWTDTYAQVGETLYVLRYKHVGFWHYTERLNLSIFASQLSLVLGIDHLTLAKIIPLLLPFYTVIIVYLFSTLFCNNSSTSYLASMAYLAFMWFGFYFNRQSFALPLHILAWYLIAKKLILQKVEWVVLSLIVFLSLVTSHPGSSFSVTLSMVALVALIVLLKLGVPPASKQNPWLGGVIIKAAVVTTTVLLTIWLLWNIYHAGSLVSAVRQTFIALSEFSSVPDPLTHIVAVTKGYQSGYKLIVDLRLFILVFNMLIGTILSLLACITTRFEGRFIILAAIFFSAVPIVVYTTYAYRWADRGFLYALFPTAVFASWFVLDFKMSGPLTAKVVKALKIFIGTIIVLFMALIPLLMYSHMAFVYPPSANLAMLEFQARHGQGSLLVIGGHTDLDYVMFAEEATLKWKGLPVPDPKELLAGRFTDYNLISTTFRAYTKDVFVKFDPPLTSAMKTFEDRLIIEQWYSIVYQSDKWHKVYRAPLNTFY